MPKFSVTTLGCKVNQCESAAISERFKSTGWDAAGKMHAADVCIVNTCTVTQKAAMQSRQAVRQAIRSNPKAKIVVTGCYAQTEADAIQQIDGVHYIVGHGDKLNIPGIILSDQNQFATHPVIINDDSAKLANFDPFSVTSFGNRSRPFLKIQDGCNAFCSYCIVPYARGRSRSMPFDAVIENLRRLKSSGFREVVLSGIHIGCYGLDLVPKTGLLDLLRRIDKERIVDRVRISSIEPNELTDEMIRQVADSEHICNHFHIPLQSGDDQILRRMRRPYTRSFFEELIYKINTAIPDAAVGVDAMIGFPGESRQAFENTYALIEALPITYLHVFPFSARKKTPAAAFDDKIPDREIRQRSEKMRRLGLAKKVHFYRKNIGRCVEVLVENKKDALTGMSKGLSANYIPVFLDDGDALSDTLIRLKISRILDDGKGVYAVR